MSEAMIVSPLARDHLSDGWSTQGLNPYKPLQEQRQNGLRSVTPSAGQGDRARKG